MGVSAVPYLLTLFFFAVIRRRLYTLKHAVRASLVQPVTEYGRRIISPDALVISHFKDEKKAMFFSYATVGRFRSEHGSNMKVHGSLLIENW